uniref:Uncharacterized protein n=1 Tax=Eutreptiella gymnastica TaxID=73025 RepID=A0A7S1I9H3_9EUGL|mmetsp:Transcript_140808/g.245313  ORF Transcript_140808/g.245313 Transcript_140808/m.245313 type:complete len:165 (+) Transcript_140808:105-599(+)
MEECVYAGCNGCAFSTTAPTVFCVGIGHVCRECFSALFGHQQAPPAVSSAPDPSFRAQHPFSSKADASRFAGGSEGQRLMGAARQDKALVAKYVVQELQMCYPTACKTEFKRKARGLTHQWLAAHPLPRKTHTSHSLRVSVRQYVQREVRSEVMLQPRTSCTEP